MARALRLLARDEGTQSASRRSKNRALPELPEPCHLRRTCFLCTDGVLNAGESRHLGNLREPWER